jgi:hypothetical protein
MQHKAVTKYSAFRQDGYRVEEAFYTVLSRQDHDKFVIALTNLLEVPDIIDFARNDTQTYLRRVIQSVFQGRFRDGNKLHLYTDILDWFFHQDFTQDIMGKSLARSAFTIANSIPVMNGRYMVNDHAMVHVGIYPVMGGFGSDYDISPRYLLVKRPNDKLMKFVDRQSNSFAEDNHIVPKEEDYDYLSYLEKTMDERNDVTGDTLKAHFAHLQRLQGELILAAQNLDYALDKNLKERQLQNFDDWYEQADEAIALIKGSDWVADLIPSGQVHRHYSIV